MRLSSPWVNATPYKDLITSSNMTGNASTIYHSFLTKDLKMQAGKNGNGSVLPHTNLGF